MDFGKKLAELLKEKGISVPQLARMSGVNQNSLYSYIRRNTQKMDPVVMQKIANAIGVELGYFLGETTENSNEPVSFSGTGSEREAISLLFLSLTEENQQKLLEYARLLLTVQQSENGSRE